jgi:hemerythrin
MSTLQDDTRWSDELALGDPTLDASHRALFDALTHLATMPAEGFLDAYEAAVAALERDFRDEEDLMERLGYPGLQCHREQHARALAGLHHAFAARAEGDPAPARHSVDLLAEWLYLHITTMDQALAAAALLAREVGAATR